MSLQYELYQPGDSWLHRLDPRATLGLVLAAGILALLYKNIALLAMMLTLAHVALLSAGIPRERIAWLWRRLAPLVIMILILQPVFAPGPGPDLARLGPLRLTVAGLLDGLSFALRAATLAFVAALLLLTTEATDLVQGLVKLGLPYTWGLTVGLSLRYLPTTYGLYVMIGEAQQARGWVVDRGNLAQRLKSYVPILVATIIAALRLSDRLGLALASRGLGYPAERTIYQELRFGFFDGFVLLVTLLVFAALVAVRFGTGFGSAPW